jgi:uncharacterized protein YoaH (UPF0181 family)
MTTKTQISRKNKRPDNRPARANYWASGQLAVNKIKNLVRHNGMSVDEAISFWDTNRKRHRNKFNIPTSYIRKILR